MNTGENQNTPAGGASAEVPAKHQEGQAEQRMIDDPILAALAADLEIETKEQPASDAVPSAPEIKAADDPKSGEGDSKPGETPPGQKPEFKPDSNAVPGAVKRGSKEIRAIAKEVVEEELVKARESRPLTPIPAPAAAKETKPDPEPENLSDDQREELADAEYAEKQRPEKFKGMAKKLKDFYAKADEWMKENRPNGLTGEDDTEFVDFVKANKPSWSGSRQAITVQRLADERVNKILEERSKETESKIELAQREAREAKILPAIEKQVHAVASEVEKELATDDEFEKPTYKQYADQCVDVTTTYLRFVNRLDSVSDKNPRDLQEKHAWIIRFVGDQAEKFAAHGGQARVRNGRSFVTPLRLYEMQQANADTSGVWTFGSDDVVKMIKAQFVSDAKRVVTEEAQRLEKRGWTRAKPASVPKQTEQPKPTGGPKATATVSPGVVVANGDDDLNHPGKEIVRTLGLA